MIQRIYVWFVFLLALPAVAEARSELAVAHLAAQAQADGYDELIILYDGSLMAQWSSEHYLSHHELMSVTKSIVALAIGGLIDDGRLRLDDRLAQFFPAWRDDPRGAITVDEILSMTSGLSTTFPQSDVLRDCVGEKLRQSLSHLPGTHWQYNNDSVNLLTGIVQQVTGVSLERYTQELLFTPLGITNTTWQQDSEGRSIVMCGLAMSPLDLAKIGRLVLDRGVYEGRRVISSAWIDALAYAAVQPDNGRLWWLGVSLNEGAERRANAHGLSILGANGSGGQFLLVEQTTRTVVVLQTEVFARDDKTIAVPDFRAVLDAFVDLCIASQGSER